MENKFIEKLAASHSVQSLFAEERVCRVFEEHHWHCFQSAFYRDNRDDKLREIDVVARQLWKRGQGAEQRVVRLNLVVEVKSAREWHIVFSGRVTTGERMAHIGRFWAGSLGEREEWLRRALHLARVPESVVPELVARLESHAFPRKSGHLLSLAPPPPPSSLVVTAFRETNTDKEKELDTSVLWRAMSGLRSATAALAGDVTAWHAESFEMLARIPFGSSKFDAAFDAACQTSVRFLDVFHPVVVIDAPLWSTRANRQVQNEQTCRFVQLDPIGQPKWWCDVVHSSAFATFAANTSSHYRRFLSRRKARRDGS